MDKDLFFAMDSGGRQGTPENCLKDDIDWILENLLLAVELLITGTVFQTVLVALH